MQSVSEFHSSMVRYFAHRDTPLPAERGNTRDVTKGLRYQAASAADRHEIASNLAMGIVLGDVETDNEIRRLNDDSGSDSSSSNTTPRLTALFAGLATPFRCLGDGIYHVTTVIVRRFRFAQLTPAQIAVNKALSSEREAVEHGFAKIFNLWKYTDHEMNVCLLKSAIGCGKAFRVAVLLTNFHSCMRGNQVATHFGCSPPSISSYLNGGTAPQHLHI